MTPSETLSSPLISEAPKAHRFGRRMMWAGLGLGVFAEWAFDGHPLGLSVPLFALACIGALRSVGGREGWQSSKSARWLLGAGLFFASFVAIRDSSTMAAFNVAAFGWCALAALASWRSQSPLEQWSLPALFARPIAAGFQTIPAGVHLVGSTVKLGRARAFLAEWGWPAVRSAFLAAPVLLVFMGLLMSADAAFSQRVISLIRLGLQVSLANRIAALLWVAFVALISIGALTMALARRREAHVSAPATNVLQLGATEAFSLIGSVTALLTVFDAISIECALSTDACALPYDMTYAEYVHHGFAELMIAAGLVLLMLLVLGKRVALKTPLAERMMKLVSSALVLATLPLVSSGIARLQLYESAYGFTVLRVLAQAMTVLVGVLLVWRGVTLWVARERFVFGAVLAVFATLSGLNVLDVEGFVTRQNLELYQAGKNVDRWYLAHLSADSSNARKAIEGDAPADEPFEQTPSCSDRSIQSWSVACALSGRR